MPVFIFSAYFERIFLVALETTGGFGDSILNGIMPALMVYVGRYQLKFADENRTPGGKALLIAVMLFFLCSLILEILISTGFLCLILDLCNSINYVN